MKTNSFRKQLVMFGLVLVSIIALPVLVIEAQRPWQALDQLILRGNIVVSDMETKFAPDDLRQMNNFALRISELTDKPEDDYLTLAFGQIMERDQLLRRQEIEKILSENDQDREFDYQQLQTAFKFWQEQFFIQPELLFVFRQYKQVLSNKIKSAESAGFIFDDAYIMVDDVTKLCFLLDGSSWFESTYPGQEYDVVANDCPYFRNYLQQGTGFDHDPRHYVWHIFPKFNTDEWGTWFSVWLASKQGGQYNVFALDLDAVVIKKMMVNIAISLMVISLLIILGIILMTSRLSLYLSRPIHDLVSGTEAIMQGNFEHQVPKSGSVEFIKLINFFNLMITNLKERLNMKQTLEKLLSKELAEQAAKHGLVLGGQNIEVSNLFTDFAGFSTITQNMKPEDIVRLLNDYFDILIPIIKKWGGFPDKYIGDAIVVIFGAPVLLDNHAEKAVACAIEMQKSLRLFNAQRKQQGKTVLEMRVGINSGNVIAGAIGSDLKLEYTSIGETTNLANRMEASCQIGHILISENTYQLISSIFFDGVDFDESPNHFQVKGYQQEQAAYNIYVVNLSITKDPTATNQPDYYIYEIADFRLKNFDSLAESKKSKFNKVVSIPS